MPKKAADVPATATTESVLQPHLANLDDRFARLEEPFEPEDVLWIPQSVNDGKAVAAAYADKRAYQERMDQVVGRANWSVEIGDPTIAPFIKIIKAKYDWKRKDEQGNKILLEPEKIVQGHKVFVVATVTIAGLAAKSSTGSAETGDENSITTAEAQAVKRAISMWGPGRYFYDLPKQEVPYSYKDGFKTPPVLPEWAIPKKICSDCSQKVDAFLWKDRDQHMQSMSATEVLKKGRLTYNLDLCANCQGARKKAGTTKEASQRLAS